MSILFIWATLMPAQNKLLKWRGTPVRRTLCWLTFDIRPTSCLQQKWTPSKPVADSEEASCSHTFRASSTMWELCLSGSTYEEVTVKVEPLALPHWHCPDCGICGSFTVRLYSRTRLYRPRLHLPLIYIVDFGLCDSSLTPPDGSSGACLPEVQYISGVPLFYATYDKKVASPWL